MENRIIPQTELGPEIIMDTNGSISIAGKSMMEDAAVFYGPCHAWVKDFLQHTPSEVHVNIDLTYFNSSSAKQLLKLLMSIDESDTKSTVYWKYPADNEGMLERGQEFEVMLDMKFKYIPK